MQKHASQGAKPQDLHNDNFMLRHCHRPERQRASRSRSGVTANVGLTPPMEERPVTHWTVVQLL